MKIWHSIIIGIAVILGCFLHSTISALPEREKIRRGYEMQVRVMEMTPREIKIGDATLLYLPRIRYRDLSIDVDYEFYTYEEGQLKKLKLTQK